jgi:hydrogenase expression/formation protein HypD
VKYLDEFNDPALARQQFDAIAATVTRPWALMEVCGGQTHSIVRNGIDQLLPDEVELIHGPGCPVCVTPLETIDRALVIAARPDVIFCSFGDMLRVPGSRDDLFKIRSNGGDVRVVYSPLDAVGIAEANPDKQVVFFGIGFETTAPANAMTVVQARARGITNFSMLVSHVLVPPAVAAIASSPVSRVDAFLAAGHVCTVMGTAQYGPLVERFHVPIVVTGFEPLDVLEGIRRAIVQLEEGRAELENAYPRAVASEGNRPAQHRPDPAEWLATVRGLPRLRRRASVRGHRPARRGVAAVPLRRGPPGADQAQPVRAVRHHLHPAQPARRHDGLLRGRVRRLLPVPPPRRGGGHHRWPLTSSRPSIRPRGRARCRCATTTASSRATAAVGGCRRS